MDFLGNKCPVCDKYFHADDDIVVCPECGTPHHRECFEAEGHCHNEALHSSGYDYSEDPSVTEKKKNKFCTNCGKEIDSDAFYCKYCGAPQANNSAGAPTGGQISPTGTPFNTDNGAYPLPFMDPLGGVPADSDLGDGVTAGEAAKYVKQNTPYFVRVFSNIRNYGRSKFNFAAALFTGGYMLYRKMYKLGAVLTVLQAIGMIASAFLSAAYNDLYEQVTQRYYSSLSQTDFFNYVAGLSSEQLLAVYIPLILSTAQMIIMILCGISFNRMYMKHCKREISRIKAETKEPDNPETVLQTKGGVNMPLAISLIITNMIINYLPGFIQVLL